MKKYQKTEGDFPDSDYIQLKQILNEAIQYCKEKLNQAIEYKDKQQ